MVRVAVSQRAFAQGLFSLTRLVSGSGEAELPSDVQEGWIVGFHTRVTLT